MPYATTDDNVKLWYEETGSGQPIVFVHEFAADNRSWEMQMRHFGQRYRCITYNARGYPPSDVPRDIGRYSQARAVADAAVPQCYRVSPGPDFVLVVAVADMPSYHAWQQRPSQERREDILRWTEPLQPLYASVNLLLRLLRM